MTPAVQSPEHAPSTSTDPGIPHLRGGCGYQPVSWGQGGSNCLHAAPLAACGLDLHFPCVQCSAHGRIAGVT